MWGRFMGTAKTSQSPLSTNADTAYYKTLLSKPLHFLVWKHITAVGIWTQTNSLSYEASLDHWQTNKPAEKAIYSSGTGKISKHRLTLLLTNRDRWNNPLDVLRGTVSFSTLARCPFLPSPPGSARADYVALAKIHRDVIFPARRPIRFITAYFYNKMASGTNRHLSHRKG